MARLNTSKVEEIKQKDPPKQSSVTEDDLSVAISQALNNMNEPVRVKSNWIRSGNFQSGVIGWQIDALGNVEFNNGTFRGTITATGGNITGDLSVSGSLLSDDGSGFQTKIVAGKVSFLKSLTEKGFIKTGSDSTSLQLSCVGIIYFTDLAGVPNMAFSQTGVISFSGETGALHWPSGRQITSDGSSITADGNLLATAGMRSTGYTTRVGVTDYSGANGTFKDQAGNTVRVRGGIITNLTE